MNIVEVTFLFLTLFTFGLIAQQYPSDPTDKRYAMRLDSIFKRGTKWHLINGKPSFLPNYTRDKPEADTPSGQPPYVRGIPTIINSSTKRPYQPPNQGLVNLTTRRPNYGQPNPGVVRSTTRRPFDVIGADTDGPSKKYLPIRK